MAAYRETWAVAGLGQADPQGSLLVVGGAESHQPVERDRQNLRGLVVDALGGLMVRAGGLGSGAWGGRWVRRVRVVGLRGPLGRERVALRHRGLEMGWRLRLG